MKKVLSTIIPTISVPLLITWILSISFSSCKKYLEVGPPTTSSNAENVFINDNSAAAVMTGEFTTMSSDWYTGGLTSLSLLPELSSDNLVLGNSTRLLWVDYYKNTLTGNYLNSAPLGTYWEKFYKEIYLLNSVIEGVGSSKTLTLGVKNRLIGEALFCRALYYFYLVNIYGDVPLVTTTDYVVNSSLARTSSQLVYQQITSDLKQAVNFLTDDYVKPDALSPYPAGGEERVRPNRLAAIALQSRVYLYLKNYAAAEAAASEVIGKSSLYELLPVEQVFLKNSRETIWALQPTTLANTHEAFTFRLITGLTFSRAFYLSPSLLANFENDMDKRKQEWIGTYVSGTTVYPYVNKYKNNAFSGTTTEYSIVLRLAEQYLIRAEARAEQGNLSGSQEDLNTIRQRAGLDPTSDDTRESLIQGIMKERRNELFLEYGDRWFDLKRTGRINDVMTAAAVEKETAWESYKALFPLPNSEIRKNAALVQNPNYIY